MRENIIWILTMIWVNIFIAERIYQLPKDQSANFISKEVQADFIFEGTIMDKVVYTNGNHGLVTSYKVHIHKLFKGTISCGMVEIITPGGNNGILLQPDPTHSNFSINYAIGYSGMFFGTLDQRIEKVNGDKSITLHGEAFAFYNIDTDPAGPFCGRTQYTPTCNSAEELYEYLQTQKDIKLQDCDHVRFMKSKDYDMINIKRRILSDQDVARILIKRNNVQSDLDNLDKMGYPKDSITHIKMLIHQNDSLRTSFSK